MALTKVSGGILDPGINVAGIVTATGFDGPFTGGSSKNITAGIITATELDLNGNGNISGNLVVEGNLTANGDFTTLNTTLREVELLRVDAQNDNVAAGIITQRGTGDILNLHDGGTAIFSVKDGGNIIMGAGAGSVAPHAPLHIRTGTTGAITTLLKLHGPFTSNTGSEGTAIDFGTASDTSTGARIIGSREASGAKGALRFCTGRENDAGFNDGHMVIDENGNIGIGTNSPSVPLEINNASPKIVLRDSDNGADVSIHNVGGAAVYSSNSDTVFQKTDATEMFRIGTNGNVYFAGTQSGNNRGILYNASGYFGMFGSSSSAVSRELRFFRSSAANSEVMRLVSTGITLHSANGGGVIYGDDGATGQLILRSASGNVNHSKIEVGINEASDNGGIHFYTAGSTFAERRITIKGTSGRVGINTNNPNALLDVYQDGTGTVVDTIITRTSGGGGFAVQCSNIAAANPAWALRTYSAEDLVLSPGGNADVNEKVRIKANTGFFGIGTNDPGNLLEVYGTDAATVVEVNGTGRYRGYEIHESGTRKAYFHHDATNNEAILNTAEAILQFHTGDTPRMKLDGNGDLTFKDGSAQGNSLQSMIRVTDSSNNVQYEFGMLSTGNEDLYIKQNRNANLRFQTNGSTRWKIDGNPGHLLPETAGAVDIGSTSAEIGNVYIADSKKAYFGSDQDFQISHNGSHAIVKETTGRLYVLGDDIWFKNQADDENLARFMNGGEVFLYNNDNLRLTTTATGITVGGEVAASQDYPDFRPVLDLNFMQNSTLDPRVTYTRTGTASYVDETGRLRWVGANVPRFDHDPITGKSKGLLIEESRTNLFYAYNTSYLSNIPSSTYNVNANGAIIRHSDDVLAPDGSRTTTKLYWDGTYNSGGAWNQNGYARIGNYAGELTAGTYVFSFFVKRGTDGRHNMDAFLGFDGSTPTFGTGHYQGIFQDFSPYYSRQPNINGSDGTIEKFPDGWYRCTSAAFTSDQTWTPDNAGISHYILGASNFKTYYEAMPHYYWGFQLEKAAFATSYIGNSLEEQATRGADITMINGENFTEFYNPVESTIVVNYTHHDGVTTSNIGNQPRVYNIRASSGNDTRIDYVSNTAYNPYIAKDGSAVASLSHGQPTVFGGGVNRAAVRVKEDSFGVSFNGSAVSGNAEDTSGGWNPTNTITEVSIGCQASGSAGNQLSGHIQRFMYYPVGLPNSQLVTLTS